MQSKTKAIILTVVGYIFGLMAQIIIYPIFGITPSLFQMLVLGFIFSCVAYLSNYLCIKVIEFIERN